MSSNDVLAGCNQIPLEIEGGLGLCWLLPLATTASRTVSIINSHPIPL